MNATLYEAMLTRYPRAEYVLLPEVTTEDHARRADYLAIALWASRGMEMHGFEVKASRSDWLRELKEPAKAETMFGLCDRWWLVTTGSDVIKDGELPPTWGWLELRGKSLRTMVKAPKLTPRERSWDFTCRLLRKCQAEVEQVERRTRVEVYSEIEKRLRDELAEEHARELNTLLGNEREAVRSVEAIEKALGMPFRGWIGERNVDTLQRAIKIAQDGHLKRKIAALTHLRDELNNLIGSDAVKTITEAA